MVGIIGFKECIQCMAMQHDIAMEIFFVIYFVQDNAANVMASLQISLGFVLLLRHDDLDLETW